MVIHFRHPEQYVSFGVTQNSSKYPTIQEPCLHEDHHPLANIAMKGPKWKTWIATALPKEFILISALTWGENDPSHIVTTQVVALELTTVTDLWRPIWFRISTGLLPKHKQPELTPLFPDSQQPYSPVVPTTYKKKKCRLKFFSKSKDKRIRAFKLIKSFLKITVQWILHYSSHPHTKEFLTGISARKNPVLSYQIFEIRIAQLLKHLTYICFNAKYK